MLTKSCAGNGVSKWEKEVDGVNKHTAIPIGHDGKSIKDCDVKEFSIQDNKNGKRNLRM